MGAVNEVWRKTIDLWQSGGQRGVNQAVTFLQQIGWERKEARLQLKAAIKIYKGEDDGNRNP